MRSFFEHLVAVKGHLTKAIREYSRERGWRGDEYYVEVHPGRGDACRTLKNVDRPCWPCEKGMHHFPNLSDEIDDALTRYAEEYPGK